MADENRTPIDRLAWLEELERAPSAFDFHAAMRRLECAFREAPRFGEALHPSDEPVRLEQDPLMGFAFAPLVLFRRTEQGVYRLANTILGLFGPYGPLPLHLTEYARERVRNLGDRTFIAFANLFHHRMLALFHRAWAGSQPTVAQDREEQSRFDTYVGSFFGIAHPSLRNRDGAGPDGIKDATKLYYAGRLACPSRNAEGLQDIVEDYFGVRARIDEFVGEWVPVPAEAQWQLGMARDDSTLARSTLLGARAWQCDHKFRLALGPLTARQFRQFLPGRAGLERLRALVKMYIGDELAWDARLVLAPGEREQLCLRGKQQLGWHAVLGPEGNYDLIVDPAKGRTVRAQSKTSTKPTPVQR